DPRRGLAPRRSTLLRLLLSPLHRDDRLDAAHWRARGRARARRLASRGQRASGPGDRPMKYALVNPRWSFEGSVYFGCREPHLPLEYGYAKALLEREGHEAIVVDGQLDQFPIEEMKARIRRFAPDFLVVTTAPSHLFWRC